MTIKNKILFWFLLPSVLIATVATVFCYLYTYKMTKRNIFDQLEIAADELHKKTKVFLSGKKERTVDFSSDGFTRNCTEEIAKKDSRREYYIKALNTHLVTNKKPLDPDILAIFVVDLDGKVIGSTEAFLLGLDVSGETYFPETMKRGSYISDLLYSPEFRQNMFFGEEYFSNTKRSGSYISDLPDSPEYRQKSFFDVTRLLLRKGGQDPIGIIVNRYSGDSLRKVTHSEITEESGHVKQLVGFGETGEAYIVNRDKLMITESRFIENAMYNQVVDTEGVRAAFDNGIGITGIYTDYRDIPILGVSKYFEEMDWVIVASKYVSDAFAPITFLRNFTIIMGTTGIIFIVVVAFFISTGVTSSIEKTTQVERRVTRKYLAHPIMDYRSMEELKELVDLINSAMNQHREASLYSIHSIKDDALSLLKLKGSNEEWAITFDAITDITTIHDKDLKIIRANKAFYEAYNIDENQLNKKKYYEIFYGTDKPLHNSILARCAASLKPECEEEKHPNENEIHLILTYPLLDEKGVLQGIVRQHKNITEKKGIDEEIKRAKEFSENLIETAQDAIVSIDEDGRVKVWNHSAEKIFGYSRSEIMGQPITTIIPERYRKKHEEGLKRFLQTGQTKIIGKSIEVSGKTKEGMEVPIELSLSFQKIEGKRYSFTGIIRDRTFEMESKEFESKFLEIKTLSNITKEINEGHMLEEVLNHVFESFRSIIPYERIGIAFLVDNGKTVEAHWARSDVKEIHLGKGYSASLEETSLSNVILTGLPRIINNLEEYLESHPQSDSTRRIVQEGMRSSLTCPLLASGKPIGFMFFSSVNVNAYANVHIDLFIQISGQIATTIEKSHLYQQLMELNELKNGFLGMAAHDLQNPNVLMRLYLNQLAESLGDVRGDQHVWISRMQSISDSMLSLTKDFLCISSIEAGQLQLKLEPILPDVFLTNCLETNKLLTKEKSITLKLDLEKELPTVYIDSDKINQVLNNLITNATKYSLPNTDIILSARLKEKEVEVAVSDQGQGIPIDDIPKLFKMFGKASVRPTAGEKSTGLGLAICKYILKAHGGRIWVESEGMGEGATFKFTMPLI